MKIKINIDDKIYGDTINSTIEYELIKKGLPKCLGNMCPPVVTKERYIESEKIMKHKDSTPSENIISESGDELLKDMVIDINGKQYIKDMKKTAALDYVEKLEECTQCNHFDLCNALTTHYLNTLKLIILNGGEL